MHAYTPQWKNGLPSPVKPMISAFQKIDWIVKEYQKDPKNFTVPVKLESPSRRATDFLIESILEKSKLQVFRIGLGKASIRSDRFPTISTYLRYQLESISVCVSPSILLIEDLDLFLPAEDANCAVVNLFYRWLRYWCRSNVMAPCIIGVCGLDSKVNPLIGPFFKVSTTIPRFLDLADRQWALKRLLLKINTDIGSDLVEISQMMSGFGFDAIAQVLAEALCLKSQEFCQNLFGAVSLRDKGKLKVGSGKEITWKSIAGLDEAKKRLIETSSVLWDSDLRASYTRLGITPIRGILLYGLPGTGKTLLAKALASQSKATFLSISIPDLVHAQVGESEKSLTAVFTKALEAQPSIIFFDELDAIFQNNATSTTGKMMGRLLAQFDRLRLDPDCNVLVIGATNFIDKIGEELLTFGRLECQIECLPSEDLTTQLSILRSGLEELEPALIDPDCLKLKLDEMALAQLKSLSGAEVGQILDTAKRQALKRSINTTGAASPLTLSDIQSALFLK